ncbi:MAG: hypothetical protein ACRDD8_11365 [Bacteroidales bacterium]
MLCLKMCRVGERVGGGSGRCYVSGRHWGKMMSEAIMSEAIILAFLR